MRANKQTSCKVAKDGWNVVLSSRLSDSDGPSALFFRNLLISKTFLKLQFPFLSCDTGKEADFFFAVEEQSWVLCLDSLLEEKGLE